ncbi:hypothetical protein LCGC14_1581390 [marine sediment metagenome]|uniref:Uncharacterized protein n=1 Tax=marine sediment metagenome TaxID=412755 RepID=A0A0F9J2W2_9ZZZZ
MAKSRVLFIGEHPLGSTGNCGMMHSILSNLDITDIDITCLVTGSVKDPNSLMFKKLPVPIIDISEPDNVWGHNKVRELIAKTAFDVLLTIGIDIWRYMEIFPDLIKMRDERRFKFGAIFPYDLSYIRNDWIELIRSLDFPCVYSKFGYNILKDHVPHIRYFRPPLHSVDMWKQRSGIDRQKIRRNLLQGTGISPDVFMAGFVGLNQYRKDPQTLIKAFHEFSKNKDDAVLYMHTEKTRGIYNIGQYALDCGMKTGKLLTRPENKVYPINQMPDIYASFDVLVNCSIQEGLSWTAIESMLCGVPAILSDTTAHKELNIDDRLMVKCETPCFVPVKVESGMSYIDAERCDSEDITNALQTFYELGYKERKELSKKAITFATNWVDNFSDINKLMSEMIKTESTIMRADKIDAVLFAQHSAAGDVLMTTRCLKGIKERHPDIPLHYMTQKVYQDIIEGNPYVDKIIEWQPMLIQRDFYKHVYNPHGDVIAPGHWGRNSNSILSDFYWKILRVEPDDFFIEHITPAINTLRESSRKQPMSAFGMADLLRNKPIMIVHTTGGDAHFRTYKYMKDVCEHMEHNGWLTVQLGGSQDFPANAEIDLRGKLTFRESAWVMAKARIAVTVDSFLSHLAGALAIDQVILFGSGNHAVCRPKQMKDSRLVCLVPDYVYNCKGLGPCSASVRDCPIPCTGVHDPKTIIESIENLLRRRI